LVLDRSIGELTVDGFMRSSLMIKLTLDRAHEIFHAEEIFRIPKPLVTQPHFSIKSSSGYAQI
jgi:hypothetical protein